MPAFFPCALKSPGGFPPAPVPQSRSQKESPPASCGSGKLMGRAVLILPEPAAVMQQRRRVNKLLLQFPAPFPDFQSRKAGPHPGNETYRACRRSVLLHISWFFSTHSLYFGLCSILLTLSIPLFLSPTGCGANFKYALTLQHMIKGFLQRGILFKSTSCRHSYRLAPRLLHTAHCQHICSASIRIITPFGFR